jgi:putative transcriptional regulator
MVRFLLDELLKARGWTDYRLSQESGIGANVIGKYRRNLVRQPDLRIINKLCQTLGCEIGELMEYIPDDKKPKRR